MAAGSYDESLRRLLAHEGGYSNHPSDPGGPTNYGITLADYRKYVKPGATAGDVRTMRIEDARRIYREKYWDAMRCDEMPAGIDYALFDYGVNSGTGRAPKVLKRVLSLDAGSSTVTTQVIDAARRRDASSVVNAICDERLRFLKGLRTWPVFGKGWDRRVREVRAAALAMAEKRGAEDLRGDGAGKAGLPVDGHAPGKAHVPVNRSAPTTAAGGTAAAGATIASLVRDPTVMLAVLVLTALVAVGVWFFWRWWQKRQQHAPA